MMRNIQTREGFEFWDKICKVQSYAFLLSPDGRRVVKTPDVGDWIDKHDAQVIVDHAQEEINVMKAERDALQQRLNAADQLNDDRTGTCEWNREDDSGIWNSGCGETWSFHEDGPEENGMHFCHSCGKHLVVEVVEQEQDDDWHMNPCKQGHRDVGASGGVAACNQCDEKIEAATTQEAFERWNETHPAIESA
ncbi:hypothetical protein [Pseudomonas fluorescens]|uniref:Uncharacterized protein n=1 Tax=Pseudomonas fluorescens TaxID=294 RepID=A0A5E6U0G9_PSEFL|nr:hypothetical protein [Pseudomonas fluorescens]VVM98630.1 hypothetical protein PS655_03213 [Pseudomonas fluorescens]